MRIDPHDLHHDFPEYANRIHELKLGNAHFAKLFEDYDKLTHDIRRIEAADSPIADAEMEKLKYARVHLKDQLFAMLKAA